MIKAVIFDWDGVIVDSAAITYEINNKIAKQLGGKPFADMEEFADKISDWRGYYQTFAANNPHVVDDAIKMFKAEMEKAIWDVDIYGGMKDVIQMLAKKYRLGIVSHNLREIIEPKLKEHGLLEFFGSIVDGRVENIKPHPEPINICLSELGVEPHEAVMVGDLPDDITAARNANLAKVVAVSYGFSKARNLRGADIIVDTPMEIFDAIDG